MEQRKLIEFSNGSFVITLPKPWVIRHKLKKGDSISVDEQLHEIILHPMLKLADKKELSIKIDVTNKKIEHLRTQIVAAYLQNYTSIEITGKNISEHANAIKRIVRNLSGMEILEQTQTRIVTTDLIDVSSISVDQMIRRMDLITKSMIEELHVLLTKKGESQMVVQKDIDINRMFYLGCRIIKNALQVPSLQKRLGMDPWALLNAYQLLQRIEEIADRHKRIARILEEVKLPEQSLHELRGVHEAFSKRYSDVMKAYYAKDKQVAYEIELTNKRHIDACNEVLQHMTQKLAKNASNAQVIAALNITDYIKSCLSYVKFIARIILMTEEAEKGNNV